MTAPEKYICSNCGDLIQGLDVLFHNDECNVVPLITGVVFDEIEDQIEL